MFSVACSSSENMNALHPHSCSYWESRFSNLQLGAVAPEPDSTQLTQAALRRCARHFSVFGGTRELNRELDVLGLFPQDWFLPLSVGFKLHDT